MRHKHSLIEVRYLHPLALTSDIATVMGWSVATTAHMIEVYAVLDPGITDSVLALLNEAKNGTGL